MKRALAILLSLAAAAHAQFAVMHTNGVITSPTNFTIQQSNVAGLTNALVGKLGTNPTLAISNTAGLQSALDGKLATNGTLAASNVSGLQAALDAKLGFNANGQVQWTNTNPLAFTNRFRQSSDNATNPPEIRLVTKSNAVASLFYYDAFGAGTATNPTNDKDWSVMSIGNNHVVSSTGQDFGRADFSKGAISLTMENMYYAGSLPSPNHVGEFYLNISDYTTNGSGTTRAIFVVGSQTNSSLGFASFAYPVRISYNKNATDWLGQGDGGLVISTTNGFQLANFWNMSATNFGGEARIMLGSPNNAMAVSAGPSFGYVRQFSAGRTAFYINTNGVIYGATDGNAVPSAPIHFAGNTRIDGAITFNNTTNAATTRTNLGIGGGLTTNVSGGTLQFSNGILVGYTQ